jgi:hypothetical protein
MAASHKGLPMNQKKPVEPAAQRDCWWWVLAIGLDVLVLIASAILAKLAWDAIYSKNISRAWTVIYVTDAYLVAVLFLAALKSDGVNWRWLTWALPFRCSALLITPLLFSALVFGFAALYVGDKVFTQKDTGLPLKELDAIYYSFQTFGFSDFEPTRGYGQQVVMCQLVSVLLMLTGVLSLLISRLSSWTSLSNVAPPGAGDALPTNTTT